MAQNEIKQKLIQSTIKTIANVDIDSATTKQLATNAGVNEVYIYRIFDGKENLFKETFNFVDKEFATVLLELMPLLYDRNSDDKKKFEKLFNSIWEYAISDKEKCSFFIRYYYSRYYTKETSAERKVIYVRVMRIFEKSFSRADDAWWLFNHILDVVFSSAVKVLRNELPDNENTKQTIFNLLFPAINQYIKK